MKEKILNIAERLLLLKGYNAFSYKHISDKLNIKNAAVHYHFPKKSDLGIAVVQRATDRFIKWLHSDEIAQLSPQKKIKAFLEAYWHLCSLKGEKYICIIGCLLSDYYSLPEEMIRIITEHVELVLCWIESTLLKGQQNGVFFFTESPRDKAVFLISSVQGVLKLVRIYGDTLYEKVCKELLGNLQKTF